MFYKKNPIQSKSPALTPVQWEMFECKQLHSYLTMMASETKYGVMHTHIPNGGLRAAKTAGDLKTMGARRGVWDYLFVKAGLPPLWIEMKHGDNDLTTDQEKWGVHVEACGHHIEVCYSAVEALRVLVKHGFIPAESWREVGKMIVINRGT